MNFTKLLLLIVSLFFAQLLSATVTHSVGIARDAKNQTLRYVEHHQYLPSGDHLVKYFTPAGDIIATKIITYPGLPQHPEIVQADFTNNTKITTKNSNQSITMVRNMAGAIERFQLPLDATTLVDAGFDSFLRSHWHKFIVGESQVFKLAVAGQDSLLKIQITKQPSSDNRTEFTIQPKNLFIRLLAPEMLLVYGSNRRLETYAGPTNLNLPAKQGRDVTVAFNNYTSSEKLDRPLTNWLPDQ